jgi:hypothetical protein
MGRQRKTNRVMRNHCSIEQPRKTSPPPLGC